MNESVRYDRCQQVQLGVLSESQVSSVEEDVPSLPPQGTGNVSVSDSPLVFFVFA